MLAARHQRQGGEQPEGELRTNADLVQAWAGREEDVVSAAPADRDRARGDEYGLAVEGSLPNSQQRLCIKAGNRLCISEVD